MFTSTLVVLATGPSASIGRTCTIPRHSDIVGVRRIVARSALLRVANVGFDVSHLPYCQARHVVVPHRERRIGRDDLTLVALRPLHVARVALPLVNAPSPSF